MSKWGNDGILGRHVGHQPVTIVDSRSVRCEQCGHTLLLDVDRDVPSEPTPSAPPVVRAGRFTGCGGCASGWLGDPDNPTPCPRCKPHVYEDRERRARAARAQRELLIEDGRRIDAEQSARAAGW